MGGRSSRDKGQRGERQFADMLTASFPLNQRVRRHIDQAAQGGEDISPSMVPGFCIEVKWQEMFNLTAWWNQACSQAFIRSELNGEDAIPVLAYKKNHAKWRVRVPLRLFLPYAHLNRTMDLDYEEFIMVVKHEQSNNARTDRPSGGSSLIAGYSHQRHRSHEPGVCVSPL